MSASARAVAETEPLLYDRQQVQRLLGNISRTKLYQLVKDGQINPLRIGGKVVFTPDEVRRYVATLPSWEPRR